MQDVSLHMRRARQLDFICSDAANYAASDGDLFGPNLTVDDCFLADCQRTAIDVAFDPAVDLDIAVGVERSFYNQIGAEDRGSHFPTAAASLRGLGR